MMTTDRSIFFEVGCEVEKTIGYSQQLLRGWKETGIFMMSIAGLERSDMYDDSMISERSRAYIA